MRPLAILLPLLSSGCVILGTPNMEGTWMFFIDRNSNATGACVDPNDTSTAETVFVGPLEVIVDIYKMNDGRYVVPVDAYMVGDWNDDKVFAAEWTNSDIYESDNYSERSSEKYWMRGSWSEGALSGTLGLDEEEEVMNNGTTDFWDCRTTWAFDAVEVTSSENKYVED